MEKDDQSQVSGTIDSQASQMTISESYSVELKESIAFGLISENEKMSQLTEIEARFLRYKYKKLHDAVSDIKNHEQNLMKKTKILQGDILVDKIAIEKARIEETDELVRLQEASDNRNVLQKELEAVEQKDTLAKFELFELKRVHEELKNSLVLMKQQNTQLVDPVLNRLKQEINDLGEQIKSSEDMYEKETLQKQGLQVRVNELEKQNTEKKYALSVKTEARTLTELEPGRLGRQITSIDQAVQSMEKEFNNIESKIKTFEMEVESQVKRRNEAEKLKKTILEKLELNRQTLEEREQDVAAVKTNLEKAKAANHDLITRKLELNVKKRDLDSSLRHLSDQFALSGKEFDLLKRQLKKKRNKADAAKQLIPGLEGQVSEQEVSLRSIQDDRSKKLKDSHKLKEEVDVLTAKFLQQEEIEGDKKADLEKAVEEVDELEATAVHWMAEGKRQGKLLSLLSAQRDIKSRETTRIEGKEREAKQQVKIKEIMIADLTKRCNEITNRLKEFSALYEVVKNERNKYVNLIQSSAQALAEMREKLRILNNEVEILGSEHAAKDVALAKERNAHHQGQSQRDTLRQDLNRLLAEYRMKQSTVEQQIQEIDKLNIVINSLEKDMLRLKIKYEHSVEQRNVTGVQLIDRNDELCILYERSNQQQDALRKGELESLKKEEELRLIRLQTEELRRQFLAAKKRLPEIDRDKEHIRRLEEDLVRQRVATNDLSQRLEDPKNLERWRQLEGIDPDFEQLSAKVQVLEDRLDQKREEVLEKELILEEVTSLTDKLRTQAVAKRDAAKEVVDQLNDLQNKIRDVTKKMLASVSELSMYQATALRLQQEKVHREKALEEAKWRLDHGEAPSDEAIKEFSRGERKRAFLLETAIRREEELHHLTTNPSSSSLHMVKTSAEPRPTAYIPDDIGIPKPYGNLAPFKPSDLGANMRHFRNPVPKPIEI